MFKPVNRHILVKKLNENPSEESLIVLPEDYKPVEEKYAVVEVLDFSSDVRFEIVVGNKLIVDQSMLERINVGGTNYSVILDNYVVGIA
jgi:co-chaperonin GroES (HSP10)